MKLRYRKPYCARHSSVSWNLMIGRNPLWVAKQHGLAHEGLLRWRPTDILFIECAGAPWRVPHQ